MATKMAAAAPLSLLGLPQGIRTPQAIFSMSFSKSSVLRPVLLRCRTIASGDASVSSSSSCFSSGQCLRRRISSTVGPSLRRGVIECKSTDERTPPTAETNVLVSLAWYGSEAFGKVVAGFRPSEPTEAEEEKIQDGAIKRKDTVELLRADLDRSHFVTGRMTTGIYEEDCEFADPFERDEGIGHSA